MPMEELKTYTVTIDRVSDSPVLAESTADAISLVADRLPVNEETYTVHYYIVVESDDGEYDTRVVSLDPAVPRCTRSDQHRWLHSEPRGCGSGVSWEEYCRECCLTRATNSDGGVITVRYYRY